MSLIDILLVILIISASALCVALIIYIGKITSSLNQIEKDIKSVSVEINPLISSITNLSESLTEISENAKDQVYTVRGIINSVKNRVDTILQLEEKVRGGIEGPILSVATNIKAISNGINTFLKSFRKT